MKIEREFSERVVSDGKMKRLNETKSGFYFGDKKSYRVECMKEYLYSILEYLKLTFNKSPRAPFFHWPSVYIYIYEQVDISPGINVARKKA